MRFVYGFVLLILLVLYFPVTAFGDEYFGTYSGHVQTQWLDDGRNMELLEDFEFEDPNKLLWNASAGSVVDGASIPPIAWSIIGSPFSGKYRDASVIHDIACKERKRTWELVHLVFYYAMRTSGVGEAKAKIMYAAVYHFGPRWTILRDNLPTSPYLNHIRLPFSLAIPFGAKKTLTSERFFKLSEDIEESEQSKHPMSLEDIRQYK